jgi:Cu/Ag efflux protein CusF
MPPAFKENVMKIAASIFAFAIVSAVALTMAATAQQAQEGSIVNIDEPKGTVTILLSPSGTVGANGANSTQDFRLQDGLLFNALRYGDKVTFTSSVVDGTKTITSLKKE